MPRCIARPIDRKTARGRQLGAAGHAVVVALAILAAATVTLAAAGLAAPASAATSVKPATSRPAVAAPSAGQQAATAPQAVAIPTPEEFFGFAMGSDEKLARWDRILEYLDLIAANSDRVRIDDYGPSTLGNRFVSVVITSPRNHADLDRHVEIGRRLADGRDLTENEARALAQQGKVTVVLNHNIHSSEIGSSQTSVQLVYEMATEDSPLMREILDNVIMVLVPSSNPDGQIMVTDWYEQNLGGDFEEAPMPYLYHHYAGHDNNRDFFMGNLVETRYMFELMFDDWAPQVYLDQHQMGGGGARMFVPPFPDPQSPDIPALMYQQMRLVGGQMVMDLQAAGKKGIITGEMYRIYGQEGALNWRFHNVVGLLTETASARIASPVTQEPGGRGGRGGLDPREFSVAVVDPWRGGTWTLGDIVDYQMVAARAVLKVSARNREDFLFNQWLMAQETLRRAEIEGPYAWVVPVDQFDPLTAADMVQRLIMQGIEVYQAGEPFEATPASAPLPLPGFEPLPEPEPEESEAAGEGVDEAGDPGAEGQTSDPEGAEQAEDPEAETAEEAEEEPVPEPVAYAAGAFIIPGAQRGRPALIDLLEPRVPQIKRQWPDGPVRRRYDSTAYTMPMQMGVDVVRIDSEFDAVTAPVSEALPPAPPRPAEARFTWALDPRINQSYTAVNRLLADGIEVSRATEPLMTEAGALPPGAFIVPRQGTTFAELETRLQRIADEMRLPVFADPEGNIGSATEIAAARIGVYKPWQASMDEGWTRLTLENFEFPYQTVDNARIREGELGTDFDVLILPSGQQLRRLIDGISEERIMEPYAGGIGEEGVEAIIEFVAGGGTLLTLQGSDQIVLERFEVPVKDALRGQRGNDVYLPPMILHLEVDPGHPLGYGMKEDAFGFFGGGSAYEPDGWDATTGDLRVVATWPSEGEVLASGEMLGEEHFAGRGAMVEVRYGEGRIVMYGFRVKHRAQTHGTFKLLFNALYETR